MLKSAWYDSKKCMLSKNLKGQQKVSITSDSVAAVEIAADVLFFLFVAALGHFNVIF